MASPKGRLAGKRCLVTAAGQGIGRATLEAFLREGAELVVAVDINAERLKELSSDRVEQCVLDVRDTEGIKALADKHPDIDVLFNCVGIVPAGTVLETTEEEYDEAFDINVKSMYRFCREFIPKMISHGGGSIINMASVASSLQGVEKRFVYAATKGAVIGLTKAVARAHIRQGIRCNAVCPSSVATSSFRDRIANTEESELVRPMKEHIAFMENKRIGRVGHPDDIANLCLYLASDESSFHTGNAFVIDGGFTL